MANYWNVDTPAAQNIGYYPVPTQNFPPPDLSQPPPTFALPQPSFPEKMINPYHQFPSGLSNPVPPYMNGTNSSLQCPYQNQITPMELQSNQIYKLPTTTCPPPIQENCTYDYWNSKSTNCNNVNQMETEWSQSVSHTTWNGPFRTNGSYPESELSRSEVTRSSQRSRYESSKSRSDWRRERRSQSRENGRKRSISPDSRLRSSRSRYDDRREDRRDGRREDRREDRRNNRRDERKDDRRERYVKYERRRTSRERSFERTSERKSERSFRMNGSHGSRSSLTNLERCSISRRRKRSKSLDSNSRSPSKVPSKQKCLSERDLLLEKYR